MTAAIILGLIILPILAFTVPIQGAWRFIGIVLFTFLTCWNFYPKPPSVDRDGTDVTVFTWYSGILFFILGIRWIIFNANYLNTIEQQEQAKIIKTVDIFLLGYCGVLSSVFVLRFLAFQLSALPYGFIIHIFLGLLFLSFFIASVYVYKIFDKYFSSFFLGLTLSLSFFSFLGMYYGYIVLNSAEDKAQGKPYCIALDKRHRHVKSIEDLTFFTMDKSGAYHVALLVEERDKLKAYHWSYAKMNFLPNIVNWENDNAPSIPCKPMSNFAESLSSKSEKDSDLIDIYFKGSFIKIDSAYNPWISDDYISISTKAPEFLPISRKKFTIYPSVEIRNGDWINNLLKDKDLDKSINLAKAKPPPVTEDLYYLLDDKDQTLTVMRQENQKQRVSIDFIGMEKCTALIIVGN